MKKTNNRINRYPSFHLWPKPPWGNAPPYHYEIKHSPGKLWYDTLEVVYMPRRARKISKGGIYHLMLRGINRQDIFEDDEDRERLLETLKYYKTVSGYSIYGFCLMSNHLFVDPRKGLASIVGDQADLWELCVLHGFQKKIGGL